VRIDRQAPSTNSGVSSYTVTLSSTDTNSGVVLSQEGVLYDFERMAKEALAHRILDLVKERL